MEITFKNLGAIKETTLDLRPLTVIIGPNNSNKTYVAYATYGLWKSLSVAFVSKATPTMEFVHGWIAARSLQFNKTIPSFFQDTTLSTFSETKVEPSFSSKEIKDFQAGFEAARNRAVIARKPAIFRLRSFRTALLLPAERNALILIYRVLTTQRYRELRDQVLSQDAHDEGGGLGSHLRSPRPVEDFIDFLNELDTRPVEQLNSQPTSFSDIADRIEATIQGSHRVVFQATADRRPELRLVLKDDLTLDLYNASSSVKQIAPLLLYLRHRARTGDLIIIDEPEMNLHPRAQAELMEALAVLVSLGVKVLITTHSPYILAHLNTITASTTDSKKTSKEQASHLYLKDPRAFLSLDDVSAYEMRDHKLVSLKDPDYGIRYDGLSDVSAEQQQRYFAIRALESKRGKASTK